MQQALELDYTLDEGQLAEDWAGLLNLASQPGASLEQLHVFCLAHVLRRPIIVYGVKYVKSWRGENLGFARFEGNFVPSTMLFTAFRAQPFLAKIVTLQTELIFSAIRTTNTEVD